MASKNGWAINGPRQQQRAISIKSIAAEPGQSAAKMAIPSVFPMKATTTSEMVSNSALCAGAIPVRLGRDSVVIDLGGVISQS